MPELPEVETIAQGLDKQIRGSHIHSTALLTPKIWRAGNPASLTGRTITQVARRAKLLILELDDGHSLIFHLKMTGRVWLADPKPPLPKHTHLVCFLVHADRIIFEDTRGFGFCGLYSEKELHAWKFYASLGPEPLSSTPQDLAKRLQGRRAKIKSLLLNQTVLAGIGNIYADESLFAAQIHPASQAARIPEAKLIHLCTKLQHILRAAIAAGGSTISDYRNAYGQNGLFQNHFAVYGKKGRPCPQCKQKLKAIQVAGRTSTHCTHCQQLFS